MLPITMQAPPGLPDHLLMPNGSAAAPVYSFTSDSDTGLYLIGDGLLGITVAGAEVARFTSGGATFVAGKALRLGGFAGSLFDEQLLDIRNESMTADSSHLVFVDGHTDGTGVVLQSNELLVRGISSPVDNGAFRAVARFLGADDGYASSSAAAAIRAGEFHVVRGTNVSDGRTWALELGVHVATHSADPLDNVAIFMRSNHSGWYASGARAGYALWADGTDGWDGFAHYLDTDDATVLFDVDQTGIVKSKGGFRATTNGGAALGVSGTAFSGLFLTDTSSIDWNAGALSINGNSTTLSYTATTHNFVTTDAGAGVGPSQQLIRFSGSPAANDFLGRVAFFGNDSAANLDIYAGFGAQIIDPTSTSEDGRLYWQVTIAGTLSSKLFLEGSAFTPAANAGTALGTTALQWNGLELANTTRLAWNNAYTITHSTGELAFSGIVTLPNTGLHLLDTNASHDLIIAPGSDLTADRTLSIVTGDGNRTLDLGAWTAFTPTITAVVGTFTSVSGAGRYIQIGKIVSFYIIVTITTNGTAATAINASLPVTAQSANFTLAGRENAVTGALLISWFSSTSQLRIQKYDGTYGFTDGHIVVVSGSYEAG